MKFSNIKKKLNWAALKGNMCPKCNKPLKAGVYFDRWECSSKVCDFQVGKNRAKEILGDMEMRDLESMDRDRDRFTEEDVRGGMPYFDK